MRLAVFALLAVNTAYYFCAGALSKGLDSAAWLLLLSLFASETGFFSLRLPEAGMRAARLLAVAGICTAAVGYVIERNDLDALNSALWIAVVVLLEFEVRRPREVATFRSAFKTAAALLYASLGTLVLVWCWRGEWFDAYDALLWLTAFAAIEMDLLGIGRSAAST
jgi:hypothetical protein